MIKSFLLIMIITIVLGNKTFAQDFDKTISATSDTLAKKIISSKRKTIAITDFINLDESITQLGTFLSEEFSSELSNLTDNQSKFRVLERSKIDQIFTEKNLIQSTDGSRMAKELGKLDIADVLMFATITDFNGYFRVVIKLLDTKSGDALSSLKVNFVKTPSLETLNQNIVKKSLQINSNAPNIIYKEPESVSVPKTGDYCFLNKITFSQCDVKITIYKIKSNDVDKIINVSSGEKTCAYELTIGIHKVELVWLKNSSEVKKEYKEIKVIDDKTGNVEYTYSY